MMNRIFLLIAAGAMPILAQTKLDLSDQSKNINPDVNAALNTKPTGTLVTSIGSPGSNSNVPTEAAVRNAIGSAGGFTVLPVFIFGETPAGTINGSNPTFTLANTPNPAGSLALYRNGVLMEAGGVDYTLATATITFVSGQIPQTSDVLQAWYQNGYTGSIPANCPANQLVAGPATGSSPGASNCRAMVPADIPFLVTSVGSPGVNTNVPSEEAVATALAAKPTAALVTSVGSPGLDTNVPSEKAVAAAIAAASGSVAPQNKEFWLCTKDTVQGNEFSSGLRMVGLTISGSVDDNPCFYSFPSNGSGYLRIAHFLPPSWVSGAGVNLTFVWNQTSGGSGNVQWNASTYCVGAGTAIYNNAPTYNTAQSQTIAAGGGNNMVVTTFSGLTLTGCAVNEFLYIKLQNTASGSGGTTYTSAVNVFDTILNVTE